MLEWKPTINRDTFWLARVVLIGKLTVIVILSKYFALSRLCSLSLKMCNKHFFKTLIPSDFFRCYTVSQAKQNPLRPLAVYERECNRSSVLHSILNNLNKNHITIFSAQQFSTNWINTHSVTMPYLSIVKCFSVATEGYSRQLSIHPHSPGGCFSSRFCPLRPCGVCSHPVCIPHAGARGRGSEREGERFKEGAW